MCINEAGVKSYVLNFLLKMKENNPTNAILFLCTANGNCKITPA